MAKLKLERGDNNDLVITKARGKITFDEVIRFMHERDQLFSYDGALMVFAFRVSDQNDMIDFSEDMFGASDGDMVVLQMVGDDDPCPVCGEKRLFPQYCPDCGRKLDDPRR